MPLHYTEPLPDIQPAVLSLSDLQSRVLLSEEIEDVRSGGKDYVFGRICRTRTQRGRGAALGRAVAAVPGDGILTADVMDAIIDEVKAGGYSLPVYVYASGVTAPHAPELYRFVSLPRREGGAA